MKSQSTQASVWKKSMKTRLLACISLMLIAASSALPLHAETAPGQILFVCEHGNVKSLMATAYFNQIAGQQNLPFIAISRGTAPDSNSVPAFALQGLGQDGLDVAGFVPVQLSAADLASAQRIISFGVSLPERAQGQPSSAEKWDDVPPASRDFAGASASIKAHVQALIVQLGLTASK